MKIQQLNKIEEYCKPFYSTPDRFYHNWSHIESMKQCLSDCFSEFFIVNKYLKEIQIAIYFHDIVNEQINEFENIKNSCELFNNYYDKNLIDIVDKALIQKLICITNYTKGLNWITDLERVITDIDLHILASDRYIYIQYMENIRKEYSQYNDEEWRTGRRRVLGKFLNEALNNNLFVLLS